MKNFLVSVGSPPTALRQRRYLLKSIERNMYDSAVRCYHGEHGKRHPLAFKWAVALRWYEWANMLSVVKVLKVIKLIAKEKVKETNK